MVTNTAGATTTDASSTVKGNGDCEEDNGNEYSNLKQNLSENSQLIHSDNVAANKTQNNFSNSQNETADATGCSQSSSAYSTSYPGSYGSAPYGNGLPLATALTMNGPPQHLVAVSYPNYDSLNHNSNISSHGPQPIQGGPIDPLSMQKPYPANLQPDETPAPNQLLMTTSSYSAQHSYSNHATSHQPQLDLAYTQSQMWQDRPQQESQNGLPEQQPKTDSRSYLSSLQLQQQQPYPSKPAGYQASHAQYPTPFPSNGQIPPNQQQQCNSGLPAPAPSGYSPSTPSLPPDSSFYPSGFSKYNHAPRPPYNGSLPSQSSGALQSSLSSHVPGLPLQHSKGRMMSPNRKLQSSSNPPSVQSPLKTNYSHPSYPSVTQLLSSSPTPGLPAPSGHPPISALNGSKVFSGTPQQPIKTPPTGYSDQSRVSETSAISGLNNNLLRRPSFASPYGGSPAYSPQVMSPPTQPVLSSNQQNFRPSQHPGTHQMRPPGPPSIADQRPSTQDHHPPLPQSPQHTPRQNPAIVAAAVAVAAAAHTAQPGNVFGQRQQTPNYYPEQMHPSSHLQHPTNNNMPRGNDVHRYNAGYHPPVPPPGASGAAPHRVARPLGAETPALQGVHQMHPPNSFQPGFPQAPPPVQGHYQGYYPPNTDIHNHLSGSHSRHPTPPSSNQTPTPQQDAPKKPARTALQKLATLFEPTDEPGRRDFIERILRYWEDKEVPLKNAPLMGRKTLDLFRLYQLVAQKGGMQQVTSGKQWADIGSHMGLSTSSSSGFTLKKQYCKYLYGFECKERGVPEPQEALARLTEANRKRKKTKENAKDAQIRSVPPQTPSPLQLQHPPVVPNQAYPSHPNPGQYAHPMGQQYRPSGSSVPNNMGSTAPYQPHLGYYPQTGAYNQGVASQPVPPHPNQHPHMYLSPRMPVPLVPGTGLLPQTTPAPNESSSRVENVTTTTSNAITSKQPKQTTEAITASISGDAKLSVGLSDSATPLSTTAISRSLPTMPVPSPNYSSTPRVPLPPRPMHDPFRPSYPQPSGIPPSRYSYADSSTFQSHPPAVFNPPGAIQSQHPGQSFSPRIYSSYQPTSSPSSRPMLRPGQYPLQRSPHGEMRGRSQVGMKRPSSDADGLPSKHARTTNSLMQQRYSSTGPSHIHASSRSRSLLTQTSNHNTTFQSSARRLHSSMHRSKNLSFYPHMQKSQRDARLIRPSQTSILARHSQLERDISIFPPDSIEATVPHSVKVRLKSCLEAGSIEAWHIVMALKCGLLAEGTWALNVLTILLHDQRTVAQFRLTQIPGLLDALMDHYRRYLHDFFTLPKERRALGVDFPVHVEKESDNVKVFETETLSETPKPKHNGKKDVPVQSKLASKFSSMPVKVKLRRDRFLQDHFDQWDDAMSINAEDDLFHIIFSFHQPPSEATPLQEDTVVNDSDSVMVVEATLEDVLSIPCTVVSPDEYNISKSTREDLNKDKDHRVFIKKPTTGEFNGVQKEVDTSKDSAGSRDTPGVENSSVCKNTSDNVNLNSCKTFSENSIGDLKIKKDSVVEVKSRQVQNAIPSKSCISNGEVELQTKVKESKMGKTKCKPTKKFEGAEGVRHLFMCNGFDHSDKKGAADSKDSNAFTSRRNLPIQNHDKKALSVKTEVKEEFIDEDISGGTDDSVVNGGEDVTSSEEIKSEKDVKSEEATKPKEKIEFQKVIKHKEETKSEEVERMKPKKETKSEKLERMKPTEETKSEEVGRMKPKEEIKVDATNCKMSITSKVKKLLNERNAILLMDEASGSDGSFLNGSSGPTFSSKMRSRKEELSNRLLCISNIIRSISFIPCNSYELSKQLSLLKALSGTLLLRHKHKIRKQHFLTSLDSFRDEQSRPTEIELNAFESIAVEKKPTFPESLKELSKMNHNNNLPVKNSCFSLKKSPTSGLFAHEEETKTSKKLFYSTTVLDEEDAAAKIYNDPWWWDTVRELREDALVVLSNISPALDLSISPDDQVPLGIIDACLHLAVCPSSDVCDSFFVKSRHPVSAQTLALEILTKLSIKDQNVDLILATRPFGRVEKLFARLVMLICDRNDQALREFSIVLLSNLSKGDPSVSRTIALQRGSISSVVAFLEECEETGHNNGRLFRRQSINCGTTFFMMTKAARLLFSLAAVPENKPLFATYQLRLLSLSMSHLLGRSVTSLVSSVLYELSHNEQTY